MNSSLFVLHGEAFFLNSPSDYLRVSLSAQRVVRPSCLIELRDDDDALKMQLEPESVEPPANETAADAQVVLTEDQAPASERSVRCHTYKLQDCFAENV